MKKYIVLFLIMFVVVGSWQTLQSVFYYFELNDMLDETMMIETLPEPKDLRILFMDKARERAIPMIPEMLQIEIKETDKKTVAGSVLESRGIQQENYLLSVDLYYQAQIFFFSKRYKLHREKVFTTRASIDSPSLPDIDE